ncbi:MAG: hypothetical protein HZA88_00490 [Verrucomicrobia bacterium]|nr:hypothetical protein [Verrucomicrobiota bacterium]
MKPVDLRNETFESLQRLIPADLRAVLEGYKLHGPRTTEELSTLTGIGLLTVRPRTTDLVSLGLVVLDEPETMRRKKEKHIRCGVYRAATDDEVRAALDAAKRPAAHEQILMKV